MTEEIIKYMNLNPNANYKISVGSDSHGKNTTRFVTAISVIKVGNGGRYFWTKTEEVFCPSLQDRIYKETMHSITLTQELKSRLKDKMGEEFFWDNKISVHIDVGKNGATRDLVEAVVGMVKGYGLNAVIKPDSYGAFVLADRHT